MTKTTVDLSEEQIGFLASMEEFAQPMMPILNLVDLLQRVQEKVNACEYPALAEMMQEKINEITALTNISSNIGSRVH